MASKPLYDEKALLIQVSQGNELAFTRLFYIYHKKLAGYIRQITKSAPLTEEIVQDVFTKIWIKRETLGNVNDFDAYLYITCRNMAFNALESELRKSRFLDRLTPRLEEQYHVAEPSQGLDMYYPLIEEAVGLLSPQQQKVYYLSRYEGLKHEDIAGRLALSRETVKRHISLALNFIRDYVKTHANKVLPLYFALFLS